MKKPAKMKENLDVKFQRVLKTPAGFDFFVAIHDFIEHIEASISLCDRLSVRIKSNRELRIPKKFNCLKQIYQGMEDIRIQTNDDLGHERYMICGDLNRIRNNIFSESNSLWKKRELFRKMTTEIYERLVLDTN
jgi:hypothetical protein